ncbi:WhiB family transcriptional regulator [Mycolicibacterium diernhoferi]|uniref:Transcriptional regulator WhiB n=1 Tax=Mycolicibacterium diernhoferi TaxID=1801 RepID=A0A1Q4HA05_9MYCO|nr:transcription factor WhiB [Mycolicibacterium diernhoferi]OPE45200.1 transcription factor WhiB [Mycolicibacterium diernhoferi]PEG53427.1 WhiB family transcriptional regulator [Mycolicibacterium diernhoferi]
MSFEQVDFDRALRFEDRMLGSVDSAPHTTTGPTTSDAVTRPQLSLVPERIELALDPIDGSFDEDDQWQERGLCAQTDPEAFFPEKGGSTREAKRICQGCEVRDRCLEYALANDERFGIWGGLSERERRRLKRGII